MENRNASPGTVAFTQYHQPAMESGEYQIEVKQTIKGGNISQSSFSRKITFAISGERFSPLAPTDIDSVFPPADSLGQHISVLPHITLKRSTLPWERLPGKDDEELPWLILLLFRESDFANESDKPKLQSITLKDLIATSSAKFPETFLEVSQLPEESVNIIDVKKKYLQPIIPTKAELAYLAHTRQAKNAQSPAQIEVQGEIEAPPQLATIICNRLPEPSGLSSVYLVSVEGRYVATDGNFDFMGATDEDLIRLVVLASWNFGCIDPEQSFSKLLLNLNNTPNTPRLPVNSNSSAETILAQSYIPLPHTMREGSKTVSWYRGPLISGSNPDIFDLPVRAADELIRYDRNTGLFDSSYAAAWQLGRMLTLQNQPVAIDLYNWKRENAQYLKQIEQTVINPPLRSVRQLRSDSPSAPPESVNNWFTQLELLQGIPFNYLVPDELLLPAESIRFFWVDSAWVDCLQDGAFSVGRVTNADYSEDRSLRSRRSLRSENTIITGCILRSQVVSGWPNLLVDAYDRVIVDEDFVAPNEALPLKLLRMDKLAPDVLICLFTGEVKTVDIHLKAEAMHFGLDVKDEENNDFEQRLRNSEGDEIDTVSIYPIPWHDQNKGILNIQSLAQKMEEKKQALGWTYDRLTSAQFALQMIEATEKVRFHA